MEAYPLAWPEGWPRCNLPEHSSFRQNPTSAREALFREIRLLVGYRYDRKDVILSTNLELRLDGEPRMGMRSPADVGVAVYFKYKKNPVVFACDRWALVYENIYAVSKTIEALRGIDRWGASDMLDRAFTGFVALPDNSWRTIVDYVGSNRQEAEKLFFTALSKAHPDRGGSTDLFQSVMTARTEMRVEFGGV